MGTTLGCSTAAAARASRRNRSTAPSSSIRSGAMTFSATMRSSSGWRARKTTPMPPRPMTDSIRKPAKSVPGATCAMTPYIRMAASLLEAAERSAGDGAPGDGRRVARPGERARGVLEGPCGAERAAGPGACDPAPQLVGEVVLAALVRIGLGEGTTEHAGAAEREPAEVLAERDEVVRRRAARALPVEHDVRGGGAGSVEPDHQRLTLRGAAAVDPARGARCAPRRGDQAARVRLGAGRVPDRDGGPEGSRCAGPAQPAAHRDGYRDALAAVEHARVELLADEAAAAVAGRSED